MTHTFSPWRRTPRILRLFWKSAWMRDRYASPMIGGGWDGWQFAPGHLVTSCQYPPIPDRRFDWCAYFDGEEENGNYGWGSTEADAVADFLESREAA